ncbi:class F sortase [Streptomyces kebangsaanensis]|uniref:class F sortase n=1 Tax=Streptomyces kebangsaanensis TaxID=864058 RepID=UPI00093CF971|nr:class F sortase [Streptomyces kebangsaanensis]
MVSRRHRRRPWYRTRAYRLARTAVLTVVLATAGVRCGGAHGRTVPDRAAGPAAVAPASPAPSGADGNGTDDDSRGGGGPDGGSPAGSGPRGGRSASPRPTAPPAPLPRSRATTLRIPSLGIDAPVIGVGLDVDRQLGTPPADKPRLVGWYEGGPAPGESGTAVAVGHRDTRTGAAVFAALGQVEPGRPIEVRRADGRTAVYTVDKVRVFDRDRFPDEEVYGTARRPELRVITCGGLYTHRTGYSSNVVVFAHLTSTK